jgi:hypothetical protein
VLALALFGLRANEQISGSEVIGLGAQMRNRDMCDKCKPIDDQIDRYLRLSKQIRDPQTLEGIKSLIEGLKSQKKALHPVE